MINKNKPVDILSIESRILHLIETKGFTLVDIETRKEEDLVVVIYVYKQDDNGIDTLAQLNEPIYTAIEDLAFLKNGFMLEISSPGIYRKIKNTREFSIFTGSPVKVMKNDGEIITGTIKSFEDNILCIKSENNEVSINIEEIKKAALNG